jgi:KaiC/GvpD/RAD55 family RecA-like ATPase
VHQLRTGISAAYWCDPAKHYLFEPAYLPGMTRANTKHTAWFDELFEGGLLIPPKDSNSAMTLLIEGMPGTGKSTLALEFCYRTAIAQGDDHLRSLYVTTEGHAPWLITHAREFGWDPKENIFNDRDSNAPVYLKSLKTEHDFKDFRHELGEGEDHGREGTAGTTRLSGGAERSPRLLRAVTGLSAFIDALHKTYFRKTIDEAHKAYFGETILDANDSYVPAPGAGSRGESETKRQQTQSTFDFALIDTLVFDNLNTMEVDKGLWFKLLSDLGQAGPRLVIVILDASRRVGSAESWEYLADTVIRMGHDNPGGYMIRTIEIVKSRYQLSALGRHQVKVQKAFPLIKKKPGAYSKSLDQRVSRKQGHLRMRHHPFREEGGIFIYPSMHFVLSRHKYSEPLPDPNPIPTPFETLGPPLGGGFHQGRCIALTGGHGTHKSRLAFIQLLHTLHHDKAARGIVISLGEDEESVLKGLREIEREQFRWDDVDSFAKAGRLDVAYYPPGFITPEEFFHRIQLTIARHRQGTPNSPLIVIFNSLTLLHSHFPLCAKHEIFIPAVVELLGHERVTSFFVTATDGDGDQYGLLSLADPILKFKREAVTKSDFQDHVLPMEVDKNLLNDLGDIVSVVRMEVTRFAEGTSAGVHRWVVLLSESDPLSRKPGGVGGGLHVFAPR